MAKPNSKATLKEYVKRKLGAPVLDINVDDEQFDDRLDEALQYFQEYHYDGSIRCYPVSYTHLTLPTILLV